MKGDVLTSIRFSESLKNQLDAAAARLDRKKNWIITQALSEYLSHLGQFDFESQVKRESQLVAKAEKSFEHEDWERAIDSSGWL